MPVLAIFRGISVKMRYDDHPPPHIHVFYQGYEAQVGILGGTVIEGKLPPIIAARVRRWCLAHRFELMSNWRKAERFEPLDKIQGNGHD